MIWPFRKRDAGNSQIFNEGDLVAAYGSVLSKCEPGFAGSRPIEDLPADKAVLRKAIINEALFSESSQDYRRALGVAFVELATFCRGGGGESLYGNLSESADPVSVLMERKRQHGAIEFERESSLMGAIQHEREQLFAEWQKRVDQHA